MSPSILPTTRHEVLEGIRTVLREHLRVSDVQESTHLLRELQLDSIQQLTLVVELENHFKLRFVEGDEEGLETIGDIVDLVQRYRAEHASHADDAE